MHTAYIVAVHFSILHIFTGTQPNVRLHMQVLRFDWATSQTWDTVKQLTHPDTSIAPKRDKRNGVPTQLPHTNSHVMPQDV